MTATCKVCETKFHGVDRDEDGAGYIETTRCAHPGCEVYLCHAGCEHLSFRCAGCDGRFCDGHKFVLDGEPVCVACAADALDMEEPECECRRTDVDCEDARGCPYHDSRSAWNVRRRAVAQALEYGSAA